MSPGKSRALSRPLLRWEVRLRSFSCLPFPSACTLVPICSKSSPHRMSCLRSKKNIPSSSNFQQELACEEECLVTLWVFIGRLTHMLPNYPSSSIHFPLFPSRLQWQHGSPPTEDHAFSGWGADLPLFQQPLHKDLVLLRQANDFYRFLC